MLCCREAWNCFFLDWCTLEGIKDGNRIFVTETDVVPKDVQLYVDVEVA